MGPLAAPAVCRARIGSRHCFKVRPRPLIDLLAPCAGLDDKPAVMGDSAYAGADLRERLDSKGFDVTVKVPPASNRDGSYSKDDFTIDLDADIVWCPAD